MSNSLASVDSRTAIQLAVDLVCLGNRPPGTASLSDRVDQVLRELERATGLLKNVVHNPQQELAPQTLVYIDAVLKHTWYQWHCMELKYAHYTNRFQPFYNTDQDLYDWTIPFKLSAAFFDTMYYLRAQLLRCNISVALSSGELWDIDCITPWLLVSWPTLKLIREIDWHIAASGIAQNASIKALHTFLRWRDFREGTNNERVYDEPGLLVTTAEQVALQTISLTIVDGKHNVPLMGEVCWTAEQASKRLLGTWPQPRVAMDARSEKAKKNLLQVIEEPDGMNRLEKFVRVFQDFPAA